MHKSSAWSKLNQPRVKKEINMYSTIQLIYITILKEERQGLLTSSGHPT